MARKVSQNDKWSIVLHTEWILSVAVHDLQLTKTDQNEDASVREEHILSIARHMVLLYLLAGVAFMI